MKDKLNALRKIRSIADYQFGKEIGEKLFPENVEIVYSRKTGRIRPVYAVAVQVRGGVAEES